MSHLRGVKNCTKKGTVMYFIPTILPIRRQSFGYPLLLFLLFLLSLSLSSLSLSSLSFSSVSLSLSSSLLSSLLSLRLTKFDSNKNSNDYCVVWRSSNKQRHYNNNKRQFSLFWFSWHCWAETAKIPENACQSTSTINQSLTANILLYFSPSCRPRCRSCKWQNLMTAKHGS